ncbi:5-demethoxyubiquinol-8 5-hydroxylase UbiM [Neisseriaceae bacterium ESL0693]|nr:5-demethoxyubiquinol-8 5-hydroxylase UbiM [Neisseriaceae bacterium ESL0693]
MLRPSIQDTHRDLLIIGAGPAGLALARALAPTGLRITLIEQQPLSVLQSPPFDGREIALTHHSKDLMQQLHIWPHLDPGQIYPLHDAKVMNGHSSYQLHFRQPHSARGKPIDSLGFLVSNHHIRQAAYQSLTPYKHIDFICGQRVTQVHTSPDQAHIELDNGQRYHSQLLIAADSRFSNTRRQLGIGAQIHDFGRTICVFRIRHTLSNQHSAYECFHYGHTLALLPLETTMTNCVVTLDNSHLKEFLSRPPEILARKLEHMMNGMLGQINIISDIHHYPLTGVHAHSFYSQRAALIGDAAVGMHPVTAHGFNLGLAGAGILARLITQAHQQGKSIASPSLLAQYQALHLPHTRLLYHGTNALVTLFTQESPPARMARHLILRASNHLAPLKKIITKQLTG